MSLSLVRKQSLDIVLSVWGRETKRNGGGMKEGKKLIAKRFHILTYLLHEAESFLRS
jgi:hypothetical protein